jgi:flagellar biosynthesis protein FlhB
MIVNCVTVLQVSVVTTSKIVIEPITHLNGVFSGITRYNIDADILCYLEIKRTPLINLFFILLIYYFFLDRNLNLRLHLSEMRYHKSVLQCYALVMQCSSAIFLSLLATASRPFGSKGKALVSRPGLPR